MIILLSYHKLLLGILSHTCNYQSTGAVYEALMRGKKCRYVSADDDCSRNVNYLIHI
jgi:hypothetical protein